jgi:hypothetical protein
MKYLHASLLLFEYAMPAWSPRRRILLIVLRGLIGPWQQFGVLAGLRVQLLIGLKGTMRLCDLFAGIAPTSILRTAFRLHPVGDGQRPMVNY